ncbi:MAG TPA: class I SAM-dependent methyltransferase [Candidatus Binatia bacterium]|nr:class I SAM-dependent methyltransferase [Candidatus Binatia bacterium]
MEDALKYDLDAEELRATVSNPKTVLGKIYRLIPDGARVLDIGCHTGGFGRMLKHKGCVVTGMEINAKAAERARRVIDDVVMGDIEEDASWNPLSSGFDVILFLDVLEHCREPENVLRAARERLASAGFILCSIPNVAHWTIRKSLFFGRFEYEPRGILDETHLRFFTIDSARRLLAGGGYQVELTDFVLKSPKFLKQKVIPNVMARSWPGLFAYQMIFKARPRRETD